MKVQITDIAVTPITGVRVALPENGKKDVHYERYFRWTPLPIVTSFASKEIMTGLLEAWHHVPEFTEVEYHPDKEQFYFLSGTALMCFMDRSPQGEPLMSTAQVVRIPAGTQLEIEAGKAHFIAVAEGDYFSTIVVSPVQNAPRLQLPEPVVGKA